MSVNKSDQVLRASSRWQNAGDVIVNAVPIYFVPFVFSLVIATAIEYDVLELP